MFIGLFSIVNIYNTVFATGTTLSPGDLVIITANSDIKSFEFVSRVDLNTGTVIYFSDQGWSGNTRRA
ncbi:hypothetical protein KKG31_07055 [Patescibacteria group bacterium]|nr:hypothetical protein [Patescibacteria group bacterium]